MITVSDLYCYPIKSCAGTRLDAAELTRHGLANDRMLMLTRPNGQFVTQREFPELCLVRPDITGDAITLNGPGCKSLTFDPVRKGNPTTATVWSDQVQVVAQRDEVNAWFCDYLGSDVQLVAMHESFERNVDADFAAAETDVVGFADGFSILLISDASLDLLNEKLPSPVGMDRFRPNIVVTGAEPHAEDSWRELRVGNVGMSGVKPCARCSVVAVEPTSGERGTQPTAVLAEYRRFPKGVMFGMNMIHHAIGRIAVGDTIQVTSMHDADWVGRDNFLY